MIIDLQKHGAALARWLDDPTGEIFLKYVWELQCISESNLRKESNPTELFRSQGEVAAFRHILDLKSECQKALKKGH